MTRDALIVGAGLFVALLIGLGLYFIHWDTVSIPFLSSSGAHMKVLVQGDISQVAERKNYKVVSQEQFAEMWGMIYGDTAPPIPQIDFSKKQVLALFAGSKPTGGYRISVKDTTDTATARALTILLSEPSKDCVVSEAATSPFILVEVSSSSLPIEKNEIVETTPCS